MRKSSLGLAMIIAVIMTMVIPAFAVELQESHRGTDLGDCKGADEIAVWHFVANQYKGYDGELVIKLPGGDMVGPLEPSKTTRGTLHWWIEGEVGPDVPERIDTAYTYKAGTAMPLPGKLVISDAYCIKKSEWEPWDAKD